MLGKNPFHLAEEIIDQGRGVPEPIRSAGVGFRSVPVVRGRLTSAMTGPDGRHAVGVVETDQTLSTRAVQRQGVTQPCGRSFDGATRLISNFTK